MDAIKCINTRRSIRKYKDEKIPAKIIKDFIIAGSNAPSSLNDQPWIFITITKKKTMENLTNLKVQLSKFVATAPLIIACCYDETKSRAKHHNLENVALAAENILLTAHASGLGACYVTAFDPGFPEIEESIIKELALPVNIKAVCLISIGYPDQKPGNKKMRKLSEIWKREKYDA
ncbi:MAG: nitroreductase family protein [Candidatus Nanoarchaeia archaeon]|nr:nitroreductase family protein [Candidatus Nanoarchaeia archaeon]